MAELTDAEREERRKGMGASDAGPTFSMGPRSPWTVWVDKVWGDKPEDVPPALARIYQRGHDLEPYVGERFTAKTGFDLVPGRALVHPDIEWMRATPDFAVGPGADMSTPTGCPVEAKTAVFAHVGREWTPENGPAHYELQTRQQMEVMDADHGYLVVLFVDTWEFRSYRIDADAELTRLLIEGERALWEDYVLPKVPPPITNPEKDWEAMKGIPVNAERSVELPPVMVDVLAEWHQAKADAKAAKALETECKAEVKKLMIDAEAQTTATEATIDGKTVVTLKEHTRQGKPVQTMTLKGTTK